MKFSISSKIPPAKISPSFRRNFGSWCGRFATLRLLTAPAISPCPVLCRTCFLTPTALFVFRTFTSPKPTATRESSMPMCENYANKSAWRKISSPWSKWSTTAATPRSYAVSAWIPWSQSIRMPRLWGRDWWATRRKIRNFDIQCGTSFYYFDTWFFRITVLSRHVESL